MSDIRETYIYESPDGGETVYRRAVGHAERELHSISECQQRKLADLERMTLWGNIHRSAKSDPVMKDMLDKIEIYFRLKNSP